MDIFDGLTLIGGLALFLFGMNLMGGALEKRAGHRLKTLLRNVTAKPLAGLTLGTGVTALMQSSSLTTVMVVGFVNSGLMSLLQSVPIILGANLGAASTPWILSLSGVSGGSFILHLLKPSTFTPVLALIGVVMHNFSKSTRRKETGLILLGFAVLMYGMEIMSGSVAGLRTDPAFTGIVAAVSNPVVGIVVGALITVVIQSSSASIGILMALSATGGIPINAAIPIIMGQNIGTCISAALAAVGASKDAKRAACIHFLFNLLSAVLLLPVYLTVYNLAGWTFGMEMVDPVEIALINTVYKLISVIIFMPLSKLLVAISRKLVRDGAEDAVLLDERLLATPSVALEQCLNVERDMAELASNGVRAAMEQFTDYNEKTAEKIESWENKVDEYEDKLGSYLVKLSSCELLRRDAVRVSQLLRCLSDFERVSDHSVTILRSAGELREKKISFSPAAEAELKVAFAATDELLEKTNAAFCRGDSQAAVEVEPLCKVISALCEKIRAAHVERLTKGECTIETGFVLVDILTALERIGGHASNIAGCVLEIGKQELDLHEYLHLVRHGTEYERRYADYEKKYTLE
ncbi:MAG: Na/Pi cotransporter family protein [Oscillospiraceae bacterium]|nr:Na/Pi cotransporter family protein [Oscillospiraceae bacterium]